MKFINRLKRVYKRNERILIPLMLILGVVVDFITFRTIKISSAFIVLIVYWFIAGATIIFMQRHSSPDQSSERMLVRYYRLLAPLIIQFTFGATLSASFIFYWFSGTFSVSWPFMLLIAVLMIANETFRKYYMRPIIQISVYYFITFSLISLMLPYLFNSISAWIFALSGAVSLVVAYYYLKILSKGVPQIKLHKKHLKISIVSIFALMNLLYFTNLIPPIPLSLIDAGIYHHIESVDGSYVVEEEKLNIFEKIIPGQTIHIVEGDPVYMFSAVFAPFDLNTEIVHEWQHFDSETKHWVTESQLTFNIYGGRDDGYRGYSLKSSLKEGFWRVRVQTSRGQTIGMIRFKLQFVDEEVETIEIIK